MNDPRPALLTSLRARRLAGLRARAAGRSGLTLIEIMVVVAIVATLAFLAAPAMDGIFDLQERGAAKELAQTYAWLIDEAQLRNVTFRVVYNLDRGTWKVEAGDPRTLVFSTPEERQQAEDAQKDAMSRFTERELAEGATATAEDMGEEGTESLVTNEVKQFEGLEGSASFTTENKLPDSCRFAFVYTPEYGLEGARPADEPPEDPEDEKVAYTYVFPDGTAQHIVVRIVSIDDPEDGYTVEVEPISGKVSLENDIVDPSQSLSWLPTEAPTLQ